MLEQDEHGLRFDLSIPDTQTGRDTLELAQRGDLGGACFGFTVLSGKQAKAIIGKFFPSPFTR